MMGVTFGNVTVITQNNLVTTLQLNHKAVATLLQPCHRFKVVDNLVNLTTCYNKPAWIHGHRNLKGGFSILIPARTSACYPL